MKNTKKQLFLLKEEDYIKILNVTIACLYIQDTVKELEGITGFNPQIIRDAKDLVKSMGYINNTIGKELFGAASDEMENIILMKGRLLTGLSTVSPEDWQMLAYAAEWVKEPKSLKYGQLKALCVAYEGELKNG